MAQILNPCHLLPRSCGVQSVFQSSQSGSVRQLGELRCELRCTETAFFGVGQTQVRSCHHPVKRSHSVQFLYCWARDGWTGVSLHSLLPRFVCCLGCFFQIQPGCGFLRVIECFEVDGGGCFNYSVQTRQLASRINSRVRGLAAMSAPRCAGLATFRALLYPLPDSRVTCVTCAQLDGRCWRLVSLEELCNHAP